MWCCGCNVLFLHIAPGGVRGTARRAPNKTTKNQPCSPVGCAMYFPGHHLPITSLSLMLLLFGLFFRAHPALTRSPINL
ncbi:hypothetical protein KKHLCK_16220 [Candidatus Electrothrix laxa]